ncbi:MAG: hypothetical protein QOH37_2651, partial [Nocardioidaceae bacterium]|nr:hypothetical protein [Nocardioidaceae bacterium]
VEVFVVSVMLETLGCIPDVSLPA